MDPCREFTDNSRLFFKRRTLNYVSNNSGLNQDIKP